MFPVPPCPQHPRVPGLRPFVFHLCCRVSGLSTLTHGPSPGLFLLCVLHPCFSPHRGLRLSSSQLLDLYLVQHILLFGVMALFQSVFSQLLPPHHLGMCGPLGFPLFCPYYSHDALLKVAAEGVGFMVLDLPVLHRATTQVVIQLCGIDGSTALFILGGVLSQPEVDVLGEGTAHSPGLGHSQRSRVRDQPVSSPLLLAPGTRTACTPWLML